MILPYSQSPGVEAKYLGDIFSIPPTTPSKDPEKDLPTLAHVDHSLEAKPHVPKLSK